MSALHDTTSLDPRPALDGLRVLIADDHALFRQGLREMLEAEGLDVVGEAADGQSAVRLAVELQADVVLMDLAMPLMGGLEATRTLREASPQTKVVMLSASESGDVVEAVRAGAVGFVLKDSPAREVVAAARLAVGGQSPVSPLAAVELLRHVREAERAVAPDPRTGADVALTPREHQILGLLAAGQENAAIAAALFISTRTVKNHLASIFDKLGVANRVQAAVYAARHGLV